MKRLLYSLMCVLGASCLSSCSFAELRHIIDSKATYREPRQAFHFDYTPSQQSAPGSAGITFAVVGSKFSGGTINLFKGFTDSMDKDFYEMLSARGFTVRGPYRSYDEITFPDKKGSDLVLTANVECSEDIDANHPNLYRTVRQRPPPAGNVTVFFMQGTIEYNCSVSLVVAESLTNERMWTKSVNTEPVSIEVSAPGWEQQEFSKPSLYELLAQDSATYNKVGNALRAWYPTIMELSYTYLDPNEMAIVKQLAQEIRAKKVYAQ